MIITSKSSSTTCCVLVSSGYINLSIFQEVKKNPEFSTIIGHMYKTEDQNYLPAKQEKLITETHKALRTIYSDSKRTKNKKSFLGK